MSDLPDGWLASSLGDCATLQRGFDLPIAQRSIGEVTVIASNGPIGTHSKAMVRGPGVVTGRSGTIGKVFFCESDYWPLNTTLFVSDFHGNLPKFIMYLLASLRLEQFAASTGVPSLNRNFVHPIELCLPPLPEQRKIAVILSSVDNTIAASQAIIDQLQIVKKAMMEELLTRGIPGRHTRFQSCEFGKVPEQWDVVRFDELCTQVRHTVAVVADQMYQEIGIRSHGKGLFHKEPISGLELGNKQVFWIEPECLVLNIVFAWEGAVASTTAVEKGMIASHRFPMYKPDHRRLVIQYLRLLMQSKTAVHMLGNMSPGGAGRNKTLNQGALKRLRIPIPP